MGARRGAGARLARRRGDGDPADGSGHGAGDVQPAPSGAARHSERAALRADPEPARRAGAVRAAQQPALGVRLPRLRVRVRRGGARCAGAVGSAVRRLYQRRGGHHRSVSHRRARQVGAGVAPHAAPATRLRGPGTRTFERPHRAVPRTRCRGQPAHRELHHARPVLPPAAAPGAPRRAAPAGVVYAEEPAATAAGDLPTGRAHGRGIPIGARRPRRRRAPRSDPAGAVQRQGVLRSVALTPPGAGGARGDREGRAAVSLPLRRNRRADQALPEDRRDRVGAGGAAQHGAPEVHAAAAAPARRSGRDRARHRPARALQSGRGVPRGAPGRAGEDRGGGVRRGGLMRLALTLVAATAVLSSDGRWSPAAPLPEPIQELSAAVLHGRIYIAGGFDRSGKPIAKAFRFDAAADRWERIADLPAPRHHMPLAVAGDTLYAVGGLAEATFVPENTLWIYREGVNRWEARAPLPAPRGASGVGVVNGKLILVGGWGLGRKLVDSSAIYDPATNRWHNVAPIPTPRDHLTAAAVGGIVYAIGGRPFNPDHNYDLVEAYDPATNRWTKKAPMPSRRGGLASAALDGKIHAFGGETRSSVFDNHEVYDPVTDRWSSAPPLPTARHGLGAATVSDKIYVIGGGPSAGFAQTDVVEVFAP